MDIYGLIGNPLSHSFSKKYFTEKFANEKINAAFKLFPLADITQLPALIQQYPNLKGLSVTIPYKSTVIPFLDAIDQTAAKVGAVNTIRIKQSPDTVQLTGYNTDIIGFDATLEHLLQNSKVKAALILGSGGASKAVQYVLAERSIPYMLVSRKPISNAQLDYASITPAIMENYNLIVNTTPIGMYPRTDCAPDILYENITKKHILIDLIYNPEETLFLYKATMAGAATANGLQMLYKQAEEAWKIWTQA
jgi:shikimate dehydrogenase